MANVFRTSSGPKRSMAWKRGKTTAAKWVGRVVVFWRSGCLGMARVHGRAANSGRIWETRMMIELRC